MHTRAFIRADNKNGNEEKCAILCGTEGRNTKDADDLHLLNRWNSCFIRIRRKQVFLNILFSFPEQFKFELHYSEKKIEINKCE